MKIGKKMREKRYKKKIEIGEKVDVRRWEQYKWKEGRITGKQKSKSLAFDETMFEVQSPCLPEENMKVNNHVSTL